MPKKSKKESEKEQETKEEKEEEKESKDKKTEISELEQEIQEIESVSNPTLNITPVLEKIAQAPTQEIETSVQEDFHIKEKKPQQEYFTGDSNELKRDYQAPEETSEQWQEASAQVSFKPSRVSFDEIGRQTPRFSQEVRIARPSELHDTEDRKYKIAESASFKEQTTKSTLPFQEQERQYKENI
jgi:hypothetical protein